MVFGKLAKMLPTKGGPSEPPPAGESHHPSKGATSGGGGGGGGGHGGKSGNVLTVNEFVARTKKCRERGQEPTKPELIAYARYLGIDPMTDGDLMWIVDEALNAPLPSEWTEHHDSSDRVFYFNVQTHSSSWTHPLEQLHRDTYKSIVQFRNRDYTGEQQLEALAKFKRKCEDAEREAHKEIQAWTEHVDDQGQKFFYNHNHKRSVWTDPWPAQRHIVHLQMKAYRVLSKHCGQTVSPRGHDLKELGQQKSSGESKHDRERGHGNTEAVSENEGGSRRDRGGDKERRRKKKRREENEDDTADDMNSGTERAGPQRPPGKPTAYSNRADDFGFGKDSGRNVVDRLPALTGDGLNNMGRAKVPAGLKLKPIELLE